jgi:hypothetical protein
MSSETVAITKPCRTCSECEGEHHWIEGCVDEYDDDEGAEHEPWCGYVCKHCGERRDQCDGCEEIAPVGGQFCAECTKELS